MYGLAQITAPDEEPITLDRAKSHLRVDHDVEDDLISEWIAAARQVTEAYSRQWWITQQWRQSFANWPCEVTAGIYGTIRLTGTPIVSVESVKYYATNGILTTLVPDVDYQVWLDHKPSLIAPAPYRIWPFAQVGRLGAVQIEFTAGYGDARAVPSQVNAAMLLCIGYWYENRGDGLDLTVMNGLPQILGLPPGAKRLLDLLSSGAYP